MIEATTNAKDLTILELLDRMLDRGVVLAGDLTISVADVDLIYLGLRVMLASVDRVERLQPGPDSSLAVGSIDA